MLSVVRIMKRGSRNMVDESALRPSHPRRFDNSFSLCTMGREDNGMNAKEIRRLRIERISRSRACEHEIVNRKQVKAITNEHSKLQKQQPPSTGHTPFQSTRLQQKIEAAAEEQNLERVRRTVAEREAWANLYRRQQLKTGYSRS